MPVASSAPTVGVHRRRRRRIAALAGLTVAAAAVTATVAPPVAGAAERTVNYHCNDEATTLAFASISVPREVGGLTMAGFQVGFELELPVAPPGSTISTVNIDIGHPRTAFPVPIGVRLDQAGASGTGMTVNETTSASAHLTLDGPRPADPPPTISVWATYLTSNGPYRYVRGTLTFALPTFSVATDQGTVTCTPDDGQVLGVTELFFEGLPWGSSLTSSSSSTSTSTSTSTTTTTTTTLAPTNPMCGFRPLVPEWFWRVLVQLFSVRC
jgi:hypothetical protein